MADIVEGLIASLKTVAAAPDDAPLSLTGDHYTSEALFQRECETYLRGAWHCLGREDEVPAPGDYFTTRLLNESIIVVRGDDGEIRALANVCRHRGMPLASGRGSARRFVCRYHAWSYGRDGALASAPRMPKERVAGCRLHGFRTEIWRGFVYVNLSGDAAPLACATHSMSAASSQTMLLGSTFTGRSPLSKASAEGFTR